MKILVDFDLCEANAVCVEECPEVFEVNENDELIVLDSAPAEELREKVSEAVRRCPRQAISVAEGV